MAKRKNRGRRPPWTPFVELDREHWVKLYGERYGHRAGKPDSSGAETIPDRVFENSRYTVFLNAIPVPEGWPPMLTLSIRDHNRETVRDWRDLQRIKNEIVGPQHEAVELFPAESRLVDSANQYHLWVISEPDVCFPFGFTRRAVADGSGELTFMGTRQRKMENPPDDAISEAEILDQHKAAMAQVQDERDRKLALQQGGGVIYNAATPDAEADAE